MGYGIPGMPYVQPYSTGGYQNAPYSSSARQQGSQYLQQQQQNRDHRQQKSNESRQAGKSRQAAEEARFVNAEVESFVGEIAALSKDQYGCRFLQRKLENGNEKDRDLIFAEIKGTYSELMIGWLQDANASALFFPYLPSCSPRFTRRFWKLPLPKDD